MNLTVRISIAMTSKFQAFDINKYCRVYFAFLSREGKKDITYYERPQFLSDRIITSEALINAEDMKQKFGFKDLMSIYIARTVNQVNEYETEI